MKKIVSLIFLLSALMLFVCCTAEESPVEMFLAAVGRYDIDTMANMMTQDTAASGERLAEYDRQLELEERDTLRRLYSCLVYTVEQETEPTENTRMVRVNVSAPDMEKILTYAEAEVLVSGGTAEDIVHEMLDDGMIAESCMTEKTVDILFEKQNDRWLIPYSEEANAGLVKLLSMDVVLRFFILN